MSTYLHEYQSIIKNALRFNLFLLTKLPAAFIAGIKCKEYDEVKAVTSIKYKWINKNPFNSMYFASMSMAAELSTGILCFGAVYKKKPSVSLLLIKNEAVYFKKATGLIYFTCLDNEAVNDAVNRAHQTGESATVNCRSTATNADGTVVAEFNFTWSFKLRKKEI